MEEDWEGVTPKGMAKYTMRGSPESGFVYTAQLKGDSIVHTLSGEQLSRIQVEKRFAENFRLQALN
jgi:hypothetical protein